MWMGKSEEILPHGRDLDMVEKIILTDFRDVNERAYTRLLWF
jgi:hypothetical protein